VDPPVEEGAVGLLEVDAIITGGLDTPFTLASRILDGGEPHSPVPGSGEESSAGDTPGVSCESAVAGLSG
jgi:hypothetical protein